MSCSWRNFRVRKVLKGDFFADTKDIYILLSFISIIRLKEDLLLEINSANLTSIKLNILGEMKLTTAPAFTLVVFL